MKKSRIIIPVIILIIYMFLAFLPQSNILGKKELITEILLTMFIAIVIIFIYLIIKFHKRGKVKILLNSLIIPLTFEIIVLITFMFTGKTIYGNSLNIILYILSYIVYYMIYMKEINQKQI